jgi:hypothetical protein
LLGLRKRSYSATIQAKMFGWDVRPKGAYPTSSEK